MTALLSTLGAFALILVFARLKMPLALAILCGALAAGILFQLGPLEILAAVPLGALQPKSLGLLVITFIQLLLSTGLEVSGKMQSMVDGAKLFLRRPGLTMAALPAFIGLLPMPGGALFSAPMVASAATGQKLKGAWLSAVNYWYRHIWEHWWPLYPGVLLAMTLTGRSFGQFAAFQIPLGVFMALSGLLLFRRQHPELRAAAPRAPAGTAAKLLGATSPIWLIIVFWVPCAWLLRWAPIDGWSKPAVESIRRFGPIAAGLLGGFIWTLALNRLGARDLRRIAARRSIYEMLGLVLSVMVFQGVLERVQAAPRIAAELQAAHVPAILAVVSLPFIAGMVTGLAFGFVGVSFPIVLGILGAMSIGSPAPYIALAYACGHLGQMLSPIHLCYVVSNRYFKTSFGPVYRHIVPPALATAVLTALYFLILRAAL